VIDYVILLEKYLVENIEVGNGLKNRNIIR